MVAGEWHSSEIRLRYDQSDVLADTHSGGSFAADTAYAVTDAFDLHFGVAVADPASKGGIFASHTRLSLGGRYHFDNGAFVGGFYDHMDIKIIGGPTFDLPVFGVEAGYKAKTWDVTGFAGYSDYDDMGLTELNTLFGVQANTHVGHGIDLGAYYLSEKIEAEHLEQYGVQASYLVSGQGSGPVIYLSAFAGQMLQNGNTVNQAGLTVSVPLGAEVHRGVRQFHQHSAFANLYAGAGIDMVPDPTPPAPF